VAILRQNSRKWDVGWGSMDCIDMVQERDWGRALVNVVINLQVP
jgi:hypothetical protein